MLKAVSLQRLATQGSAQHQCASCQRALATTPVCSRCFCPQWIWAAFIGTEAGPCVPLLQTFCDAPQPSTLQLQLRCRWAAALPSFQLRPHRHL